MPIYDFKCRDCSKISEILCLSPGEQTVHCPDCGSSNVDRLISSTYLVKTSSRVPGNTCCGRGERSETQPCLTEDRCRRG